MSFEPPGECPNCGEYVEAGSASCDACGSCQETGWSEESYYDGLDLPVEQDERELPKKENKLWGSVVTIALVAAVLYVFVLR